MFPKYGNCHQIKDKVVLYSVSHLLYHSNKMCQEHTWHFFLYEDYSRRLYCLYEENIIKKKKKLIKKQTQVEFWYWKNLEKSFYEYCVFRDHLVIWWKFKAVFSFPPTGSKTGKPYFILKQNWKSSWALYPWKCLLITRGKLIKCCMKRLDRIVARWKEKGWGGGTSIQLYHNLSCDQFPTSNTVCWFWERCTRATQPVLW